MFGRCMIVLWDIIGEPDNVEPLNWVGLREWLRLGCWFSTIPLSYYSTVNGSRHQTATTRKNVGHTRAYFSSFWLNISRNVWTSYEISYTSTENTKDTEILNIDITLWQVRHLFHLPLWTILITLTPRSNLYEKLPLFHEYRTKYGAWIELIVKSNSPVNLARPVFVF